MKCMLLAAVCLAASASVIPSPPAAAAEKAASVTTAPAAAIDFNADLKLSAQDRIVLENFINHAVVYARGLTADKVAAQCKESPETFAWVQFKYLECLNVAFELTHDPQYLDLLRNRFTLFRNIMTKGDDGYLGWYGKPIPPRRLAAKPDLQIDELQMNFRAIALLAHWVELARSDPAYAAKNAATITEYLDLMEKQLYPKWDARGHFVEIPGRGGVYRGLDYPSPIVFSLSFEKMSNMVDALLKLNHITGNDVYLKRALQLGSWYKSNLTLKDDHYEWMSWVPAGKWDINPDKPDAWKIGWIAPDPIGSWYVTSLSIALNLYQNGLLFNDTDLQRFLTTQKTMCWNGNMDKPEYRTVAGVKDKNVKGRFLSDQLANYDPTLAKLAFAGPHEAEVLKDATNSWKGGANAQDYIIAKYLMRPIIEKNPQPYAAVGKKFLADAANKTFYDSLFLKVIPPGAVVPLKPSQMFPAK